MLCFILWFRNINICNIWGLKVDFWSYFSPFLLLLADSLLPFIVPFVLSFPLPVSSSSLSCRFSTSLSTLLSVLSAFSLRFVLKRQSLHALFFQAHLLFQFLLSLLHISLSHFLFFYFFGQSHSFLSLSVLSIYYHRLRKTEESFGGEPEQTLISNQPPPTPHRSILPLAAVHN